MSIAFTIIDLDVSDIAFLITDRKEHRIDKTFVGGKIQPFVPLQNFRMNLFIHLYGIALHKLAGCLIVALTFDALDLTQQTGKKATQLNIVGDLYIRFPISLDKLHRTTVLVAPMSDKRPVTHVGLLYLMAGGNTDELGQQSVHHICVIL